MNNLNFQTIAAIATPPGIGGVGIIRISGPEALSAGEKLFKPFGKPALREYPPGTLVYGELHSLDGTALDRPMAVYFANPHSFTGEDVYELHCHGSSRLLHMVMFELASLGVRMAEPGEFSRRAFLNGKLDLASAEAILSITNAESEQAVKNAALHLSGAFGKELRPLREKLLDLTSKLTVDMEMLDQGVELSHVDYIWEINAVILLIDNILSTYRQGQVISDGIRTVIVGKPNVGKSSILNFLAREDLSIVTSIAGTTRDIVRTCVNFAGLTLNIADTAGIHESNDLIEMEGILRAQNELISAELVLAVFDGSVPSDENDKALFSRLNPEKTIILINKSDLTLKLDLNFLDKYTNKFYAVSAATGEGFDLVESAIRHMFELDKLSSGTLIITNARHYSSLLACRNALSQGKLSLFDGITADAVSLDIYDALASLDSILGLNTNQEIINSVFEHFCVGK